MEPLDMKYVLLSVHSCWFSCFGIIATLTMSATTTDNYYYYYYKNSFYSRYYYKLWHHCNSSTF